MIKGLFRLLVPFVALAALAQPMFLNFEKAQPVSPCEKGERCFMFTDKQRFLVAERVIVKTALPATLWTSRYSQVLKVQTLAQLGNGALEMLTLDKTEDPFAFAAKLSAFEGVEYAQPDIMLLNAERSLAPGSGNEEVYTRFGLERLWRRTKGKGARVAVIDDGFALDHPAFSKTDVLLTYDADLQTLDAAHKSAKDGHGTTMASIIFAEHGGQLKGIAPEASLIAIRQADMWSSHLIVALYTAHLSGADVISASWTLPFILEPFYDTLRHFIQNGRGGKGGIAVFASGNGAGLFNPVCTVEGMLCVGAADYGGSIKTYTRTSKELDLLAPVPLPAIHAKSGRIVRSGGTSSATAFVSGVAALMIAAEPESSGERVRTRLIKTAAPTASGYPIIRPDKAIKQGVRTHE